jgi:mRNA degradation ribonuclease J1/J2
MAESAAGEPRRRPWWQWVIGAFVVLVILMAIFGDANESNNQATTTVPVTQSARPAQTQTTATQNASLSEARKAVDGEDYAEALAIARALGPDEEDVIRRRIANRIARRANAALRAGDRGEARALLARAERYPTTALTRQVRSR